MIYGVPLDQVGVGSGWALVALFVILVMTGRLVPRRTHEDTIHDRDEWRAAHRISEQARQVALDQNEKMLEHAKVTEAVLGALSQGDGGAR